MIYDDKKFIGAVIKSARKSFGLSQYELAEMVDMCDKNIGNIENGKQFPQVNNFLKLIEVLGLKIEDFGVKLSNSAFGNERMNLVKLILASNQKEFELYNRVINAINQKEE